MSTVETILHRFGDKPFEAARLLVRSCADDPAQLASAGETWCTKFSASFPFAENDASMREATWSSVHQLLVAASSGCEPYSTWVSLAREEGTSKAGSPFVRHDEAFIRAPVYAWPHRRSGTALLDAMVAWARECGRRRRSSICGSEAAGVATALRQYPDVAYAMLDASKLTHRPGCEPPRAAGSCS